MKKHLVIAAGFVFATGFAISQKKSETDAALAFKSFESAFQSQDLAVAKKNLLKAKEAIDLAAAHPDTQKSPKTLFYKGEIYASIDMMRLMKDEAFNSATPADARQQAITAYAEAFKTSDKFDEDIKNSMFTLRTLAYSTGSAAYDKKEYLISKSIFESAVEYAAVINEIDTTAMYYVGTCAEQAGDFAGAAESYKKCASLGYKPEATYSAAGINLVKAGKNEEAMTFLQEAIKKSPKDKILYYALGTIAMELNKDELVSENLNKAIELDPNFTDAHYNLGVYFSEKGNKLRSEAGALPPSEKKKYDELNAKSLEFYGMAAAPLEKYVESNPKDKAVLKSLFQIFRALKNTEKEAKYKKMFDEA